MKIGVTGGTGFVGSHVVELLLKRGDEVNCLVLPSEGKLWLEPYADGSSSSKTGQLHFFEGSVTDPGSLGPFLDSCDAIVNIAGLTRAKTEERFLEVNAGGAANLVEAALALEGGPRQIVSMSSLAAVGPCPEGRCLDEDDELHPITPYGRSKAALETALRTYEGRMHFTFIRAPGVYGPRDRDFFQYFRLVSKGWRLIAGSRNVTSLVYVKTLAAAIVSCIANPAAHDQAFFIADEGEYDWDDISAMIEAALGKRTKRIAVPCWAVAVLAFFSEAIKPFSRRPPLLGKDKLREMRQSRWVVSTAKAKRVLGFKPMESTAEAMTETGRWYRDMGWIS